ncbi:MAG: solute carrier family 23 protein [Syntrophobacteraceae bacterium]
MTDPPYIYDIDEKPPLRHAVFYGLQWTMIMFPNVIIAAALSAKALQLGTDGHVRFFQLMLLASGVFTSVQCLWGHRYPLLEGPSTALLLTFMSLAPYGVPVIQAGSMIGGLFLVCVVVLGKLKRVTAFSTPNVVGVILMLISFTLLPYLMRTIAGIDEAHPQGRPAIFLAGLALVLVIASFSFRFSGFLKTISLLLGMLLGTAVFFVMDYPGLHSLTAAQWFSMPREWVPSAPVLYWPAIAAMAASYVAALVNSLGSLHGIANITDRERLPTSVSRGIMINGVEGICCGFLGIVGMVSYSLSPGVVLANRVASRYAVALCGVVLAVAAFVPKLAALLALVPAPVVASALLVAMGTQVGAALSIISSAGMSGRDYFVVGIPVMLGTLTAFLPPEFTATLPPAARLFAGNGLIVGIFLVLLLEHVLMRKR